MTGKIDGTGVIQSDDGSTIAVENAQIPGDLRGVRGDGVGFGPLRLTSWAESTTVISDLEFEDAEAESWFPLLAVGGVAGTAAHYDREDGEIHNPERTALSRRGLLVTIGAATLFVGKSTAQSDSEQTYNVASFDLLQNLRGLKVDVDAAAADWFDGEDVEFFLSADGSMVGTFDADEPGKTLSPGTTGPVELESDTAVTFVQELIAKATADDKVIFEFRPQDTSFAGEPVDSEIELSSQPVVVETVQAAAPKEVLVRMNGTIIPHADESGDSAVGEWYVRDNTSLMYVVGPQTPDTSLVEVQANLDWTDRQKEKYFG